MAPEEGSPAAGPAGGISEKKKKMCGKGSHLHQADPWQSKIRIRTGVIALFTAGNGMIRIDKTEGQVEVHPRRGEDAMEGSGSHLSQNLFSGAF